jgi:hypothetical protein
MPNFIERLSLSAEVDSVRFTRAVGKPPLVIPVLVTGIKPSASTRASR